jgi:hypothetical protein
LRSGAGAPSVLHPCSYPGVTPGDRPTRWDQ